jgi:hypothetical protein
MGGAAVGGRDLVALAEPFAGGDHPVGEVEHQAFKPAGLVDAGLESQPLKLKLMESLTNSLSIVLSGMFILEVVHFVFLWLKTCNWYSNKIKQEGASSGSSGNLPSSFRLSEY